MRIKNLISIGILVCFLAIGTGCGKKANPLNPSLDAGSRTNPLEANLPYVTGVTSEANAGNRLSSTDRIAITFSEPMDEASVRSAVTVQATAGRFIGSVSGTVTYAKGMNKAYFQPSGSFTDSTAYLVTIANSAKDLQGNPLDGNRNNMAEGALDNSRWVIYGPLRGIDPPAADINPPRVDYNSSSPRGNRASVSSEIIVGFRMGDLDINGATLTTSNVTVWDEAGNQVTGWTGKDTTVGGRREYRLRGVTLNSGTVYEVRVSTNVADNSGNSLDGNQNDMSESAIFDEVRWKFSTDITGGNAVPPMVQTASRIDPLTLKVDFTQVMDTGTFTDANIRVYTRQRADSTLTGYVSGTITTLPNSRGFTYSLENAPAGALFIWISKSVQSNEGSNQGRKFKLDTNGNGIGGEERYPANRFPWRTGNSMRSDDFVQQF